VCFSAVRECIADIGPAKSRAFCADTLAGLLGHSPEIVELRQTASLIASELLTNSVNAGSTTATLSLAVHRDHLRVAVEDDAVGRPELRRAIQTATSGRGLLIISEISQAWGVDASSSGKQVWAEIAVPASATTQLSCTRAAWRSGSSGPRTRERALSRPCPRCGASTFAFVDWRTDSQPGGGQKYWGLKHLDDETRADNDCSRIPPLVGAE
jgi:hypothetical protein